MNRQQEIGQKIRSARLEAKLTQKELGKKIGYSAMGVSYLEKGTRNIKLGDLANIAKVLNAPESYFLATSANPYSSSFNYTRTTGDGNRDNEAISALNKFKDYIKDK